MADAPDNMSGAKYWVSIPITGTCSFEVEAADEDSAIEAAWKAIDDGAEGELEWEYTEKIVSGNVFHGMQNTIEVSES